MLKKNLTPINRQIKLSHYVINDKLLFSVSPRAGHFTFLGLVELLQKNGVKCERIKFNQDIKKITSLKNVKKVKFVRNPFHRAVSSYTTFCNNPVFKLWGYFGLNLEQKNDLTFRQFIQLLKTKNIQNINHHLANQVENGEGELFSYDRIEKVENYLEVIPQLLKEAEVDIDLKSLEPKHIRKKIDSKKPAMDIPFKDFWNKDENKGKKSIQQPPYECFYDEELKKEVAEIYKTDLYDYNIEPIVKKVDGWQNKKIKEEFKKKGLSMPEVIICGLPRGGTTLIEEILLNTGEFEGNFEGGFLLVAEPKNFLDYNPYFSMTQEAWNLTREQMEIICDSDNFNEMYSKLRDYSKIKKKLFDKTPKYMKNLTDVIQKSPNSKVIVIVRDPRAVIYSWIKRDSLFNNQKIKEKVDYYISFIEGFELAYKKYPEKIHFVQYEKLCINPRDEIEKICKFLGIKYKKEILIFRSVKNKKNVKGEAVSSEMIYEYKNNLDPQIQTEIVNLLPRNFKYLFNKKLKGEIFSLLLGNFKYFFNKKLNFIPKKKDPLYIFLHIPKNGGTSLRESLGSLFNNNNKIYWYHDLRVGPIPKGMSSFEEFNKGLDLYKYISKLSSPEKDNINFISSYTLNLKKLQQYFPTREFKIMFILREPASRIVSLYNHTRFIELRKNNIISEADDESFLSWCKSNNSRDDFFQAQILYNFFSIKEGNEEELKEQIEKCFVVGDFNNYDEFIKDASEKMGFKIPLKRLNYTINNYKQYSSKEKIFILNDLIKEKLCESIPALRKESELIKKILSKTHSKYKPLMTPEAITFIDEFLQKRKDAKVLEFGSGYSTVWLSERTKNLVSIEHNKEWYDKIQTILEPKKKKIDYRFLNRPYSNVCDKFKDEYFDFIIVDGRDRVECLKKALPKLKKEGYILLDDAQREKYNEAKELLKNWDCEKTFSPERDTYYWKKPIKEIKNKKKPFDPAIYIASNAKLIETIGYDLQKAKKHYLKEGKSNKLPIDLFNPEEYLKKYPDLSRAFGRNLERTTRHYIVNGYKESRFWTSDIAKIDFVLKQEPHHKGALREKSLITEKILNNFDSKSSLTKSEEDIIGIGIVTYNRLDFLKGCVNNIRKNTKSPYFLVIADDGSTDGTKEWCFSEGLLVISGENRGVCWNKNRALYYLKEYTNANCILLLEDDCWPEKPGWELDWLSATRKFSHINYAAPWILTNHEKPFPIKNNQETSHIYLLNRVTGQCTACSRKALECVGYLDSRFKGYGHGHVEWTKRFMKCRKIKNPSININKGLYPAIKGGLSVQKTKSNINTKDLERNANIFRSLVNEPIYRNPWVNDKEKFIFLEEINIASEIFKKNSKNKPLMTHEAIEFMNNFLKSRKNANILEFGSGYSTVWLSERTKNLVSIEHNKEWYDKIQDILKSKNKKVDYRFLNRPYSNVCDKFRDEYFDLIIVDGRDRVECLKKALPKLKKEGYILLDDAQREKYNEAKELLKNWDCEKTFSPQRDTYYWKKPIKEIKKNIEDKSVLVAIAKNEAPYLLEWIIYHKFIIGFDEIIIYDNDSTDKTEYLLKKLQEKGLCKYIKWPRVNGKKPQHSAYDHAVYANKLDFEWIMFLDIDEFLVLKKFENIHEVIYDFKDKADCICFNWLCFGPTDQKEYNSELVIKRFTHSNKNNSPVNSHMKSIMKIDSIREIYIHIPFLKNNTKYFHICGNELIFGKNPQVEHITSKKFINQDVAQINHYQRKSEEENKFRTIQGRATVLENHSNVNMKPRKINVDLEFKFKNKDILKHVKKLEEIMEPIKKELNYSELERDFKEFIKNEVKRYNEIITKEKKNPRETPKFFIYKNKILEEINSPNLQNKISTHLTRYYMYNSIYQVLLKQKDLSGSILGISGLGAISNMFPKENKRTNISYPEYDVTNLKQIKDDSYDIVICDQVLEHVTEPFKAVSEMRRVLKKGGLLILTTCLMNQIHAHPIDFWRFTPEALRYLCKDFSHIIDATGWGNAEAMRLILAGKRGEKIIPGTEMERIALENDMKNVIVTWIIVQK